MKPFLVMILIAIVLSPNLAKARDPKTEATFGPEFTFAKFGEWSISDAIAQLTLHLQNHLIKGQMKGAQFQYDMSGYQHEFASPSGWKFNYSKDNGVIEFCTSPMTVRQFEQYAADIEDAIFVTVANNGLQAMLFLGGGHISVGADIFYGNPLLAYNFVVDFLNHNELSLGALGFDTNNAQPFAYCDNSQKWGLRKFLKEHHEALLRGERFDTETFFLKFYDIYNRSDEISKAWNSTGYSKSMDINLRDADKRGNGYPGRIEIRSVRPQATMKVWLNQIKLIQGRIEYLAKLPSPLKFAPIVRVKNPLQFDFNRDGGDLLNPPVKPQEALTAFHQFILESNQKWADHRANVWPKWVADGELDQFERS